MNIGFIGNFIPSFSTENDRKWTLLKMGHNVVKFQENLTTKEDLLRNMNDLDMLLYSHTHDPSYIIPDLIDVFKIYKENNVPTVVVHLDKWAGLKREKDVGKEATWFAEYLFMADYSPEAQELYKKHGLNVFYLPAGVVERDCYMASPDPVRFPFEIVFTGSKGYHSEYNFRPKMIEFLTKTYGDRFGHFGNDGLGVVRGHDLNTLYATAKIVVGDSCFGGQTNYVSDRYYEVRGRGGFLINPRVEGVDSVGVGHYLKGDLDSLKNTIDYYLKENVIRETKRLTGFNRVRRDENYTRRMELMLKTITIHEKDKNK